MKLRRLTAFAAAAVMMLTPSFAVNAYAADKAQTPVFNEFNQNDVNGSVVIVVDGNTSADVTIKAETPEGNFDYYKGTYKSANGDSFSFKIEGNDDRTYNLEIGVTDTASKMVSKKYTESFKVADADFTADSWVTRKYILKAVKQDSEKAYEKKSSEKTEDGKKVIETEITFYLSTGFVKGDVNEDGEINALDASAVLVDYANTSTSKPSTFTASQKLAADVNEDGSINAVDASKILSYYAATSTGKTPSWD